jgi:hypothetical protein
LKDEHIPVERADRRGRILPHSPAPAKHVHTHAHTHKYTHTRIEREADGEGEAEADRVMEADGGWMERETDVPPCTIAQQCGIPHARRTHAWECRGRCASASCDLGVGW